MSTNKGRYAARYCRKDHPHALPFRAPKSLFAAVTGTEASPEAAAIAEMFASEILLSRCCDEGKRIFAMNKAIRFLGFVSDES